jgi:hypothetical protein
MSPMLSVSNTLMPGRTLGGAPATSAVEARLHPPPATTAIPIITARRAHPAPIRSCIVDLLEFS